MEHTPPDYVQRYKEIENTFIDIITSPPISFLFRIAAWGPVLLSTLLLLMGFWGFVVIICYERLYYHGYAFLGGFGAITFTILWIIGCTSFVKAIFSDPGGVPESFIEKCNNIQNQSIIEAETEIEIKDTDSTVDVKCLPVNSASQEPQSNTTRATDLQAIREGFIICNRCDKPRPARCHHCKHCKKCVIRMDHHCPVINNCVGFNNYKYFLLTVIYCFLGCFEVFIIGSIWLVSNVPPIQVCCTKY